MSRTPKQMSPKQDATAQLAQLVASMRKNRWHLTDSQRAVAGVEIMELLSRDARRRSKANLRQGARAGKLPTGLEGASRDIAGSIVGVSGMYVSMAKRVRDAAPALFEEVRAGRMPLSMAVRSLRPTVQRPAPSTLQIALATGLNAAELAALDDAAVRLLLLGRLNAEAAHLDAATLVRLIASAARAAEKNDTNQVGDAGQGTGDRAGRVVPANGGCAGRIASALRAPQGAAGLVHSARAASRAARASGSASPDR